MYWRFGHQNASVIDHLLETGNVSLEELLEQDDLIQECKAQNPRLIEYLRDPTVLQQLLGYIISDDLEDRARFKYPFIACEVIACEVWAIFESALSNPDMLVRFWEFLDRPAPLNPVQASYFAKVIGVFLMKKTSEMLQFIKAQPNVVSKLLTHMSTSSIMDLLLKIISMEESPDGKGTVQWLSEQGLMPWLVNQLDPNFDGEVHSIASQVLLDIIAISQSSHPEQPSIGTNILIDELKSEVIVSKLVGFMLDRNAPYSTSTLINGVTIFIELIRRNNSDYDVDPISPDSSEHIREAVDLSDLLKVLATRIKDFKDLLVVPRSVTGPIETSIGRQVPLGFERLKICEMFAELLHCSNMAILNSRPIITVSTDGTVKVPTVLSDQPLIHHSPTVKEELNSVRNGQPGDETPKEMADQDQEMKEPSDTDRDDVKDKGEAETEKKAAPEQSASNSTTEPKISNVEQLEDATATLKLDDQATPKASSPINPSSNEATPTATPIATPSSPSTTATAVAVTATNSDVLIPVGDFLKMQFVDHQIIPTCFDLFFQFPWNNFLHTVVYDMVHQVFHRPMGDIGRADMDGNYIPPRADLGVTEGWNRRLTISIFKDGQLTKRITDAQRLCDYECAQPKGVRLGYMGHLTYIADETVKLLELYSQTSLLPMLYEYMDLEDWWNYVSKVLKETKERDAQVLGGMRPNLNPMSHKSLLDDGADDDFMDDHGDDFGNAGGFLGGEGGIVHEGDVASDQVNKMSVYRLYS
ncbi:SIT4 phosphatase-associated protein-domain-containing protein [Lobosporangium transversale]|uniref:SIT4 phosphatase-associated protein-domain-containing protein n=1 Tax=Lobosporangium transversale TaxID=64571 RepID=A0A1Y2H2U9_9FUNG|nr:SIT4 phosphatase-associated protein-domain-containing protein [Lobosporangium transversale]ORZ28877.1 SIT4 phosphatase-associated protein-domain-containing protein [Lobosporangium transversale]|eukprot:XP_021886550.1 SIT4 phosphatase-associated protein-domain-containing protein [Lobosporangium transversale]